MRKFLHPGWLLVALALICGGLYFLWSRQQEGINGETGPVVPLARPLQPPAGYVGSDACRECHAKEYQQYVQHPMANSLKPVLQPPSVEDYEDRIEFSPTEGTRYTVQRTDQGVLHAESGFDKQGELIYRQPVRVDYAIGSGRRGRSYVIDRDGLLFLSPVSWYSQAQRWDLSPGYSPSSHPRFEREANERCLQCHAGRMQYAFQPTTDALQQYKQPPFAEMRIGCERCHGPGQSHIAHQRQSPPRGADPILNPADLEPSRRDAVCNQCHLQGEAQILRYGRTHDDFRPGFQLGDIWSVYTRELPKGDSAEMKAVSHVEQMHASRCFVASEGKLGCISCHDPHQVPAEADRVVFYRQRCARCHTGDGNGCGVELEKRRTEADNSCIACHMPRLGATDVPHTTQTDHRVLRAPRPALPANDSPGQRPLPRLEIFDRNDVPLPDGDRKRARGLLLAKLAESGRDTELARKAQQLLKTVQPAAPDDLEVLDALALVSMMLGDSEAGVDYWKRALTINPDRRDALFSLSTHFHNQGEARKATLYMERYLDLVPWRAEMFARYSHALATSGRPNEAIEAAVRSLQLDPSVPRTYEWLSQLYADQGDQDAGRRYHLLRQKFSPLRSQ